MLPASHHIEFITPLFSKGFYDDLPEIRSPSIRGQLHYWFRALGGKIAEETSIFGGVHGGATASKVTVRVSNVTGKAETRATLPHKRGGEASLKMSFLPGTRFTLHLMPRLGGIDDRLKSKFDAALEAWLLMGGLGLRTTRGAGSFRWQPAADTSGPVPPQTFSEYDLRCRALLEKAPLRFALLDEEYSSAELARHDCSDTIGGSNDHPGQESLAGIRDPLGRIRPTRKTSPLRFRVVGMEGKFRIAALWDTRTAVTMNGDSDLKDAIRLLVGKDKAIGYQLEKSSLAI